MLDNKYDHKKSEKKWQDYWQNQKIYQWKNDLPREETFVIDTPPPTVSGFLHMGHVFSYTQADFVARFQRMIGKDVFYPMGFDDNGLPTERLVEKVKNIRVGNVAPGESPAPLDPKKPRIVSRETFVKECSEVVDEAEKEFEALFNAIALSVDWDQKYQTISPTSQKLSQASFVDLYQKGLVERKFEPVLWDCVDQTALSQADLVDKEVDSAMHFIEFEVACHSPHLHCHSREGGNPGLDLESRVDSRLRGNDNERDERIQIMTTRPELLAACVAVMVHPEDARYKHLHGKNALTPLFGAEVPIVTDEDVNMEKGTGAVMCCTFGDETDIKWFKKHNLDLRLILQKNGKTSWENLCEISRKLNNPGKFIEAATKIYGEEKKLKEARDAVLEALRADTQVRPYIKSEPIKHTVKCAERSGAPIEIVVTPQWFVKILDKKEALKQKAQECKWLPEYMRVRIEQWIDGLSWDWCISRQRYFGVPFPVWYVAELGKDEAGTVNKIVADVDQLPIDPLIDLPKFLQGGEVEDRVSQRIVTKNGKKYAVRAETDVMDTWATSSITPQLSSRAINEQINFGNLERHQKLFPADMRPQAHEIIRTWAFYTIVKAYLHNNDFANNAVNSSPCHSRESGNPGPDFESLVDSRLRGNDNEGGNDNIADIPWKTLMISGWCLAADKTKMSKSKGNIVTPTSLVEEKGSDVVRYFASTSHLGADTAYSEEVFKIGQRLITKLFNAAKFAAMNFDQLDPINKNRSAIAQIENGAIFAASDLWILSRLQQTIKSATAEFEQYEYARAREKIEEFFWHDFCDNYLEIIKVRSYGLKAEKLAGQDLSDDEKTQILKKQMSAINTLYICLNTLLKLLAPFIPHICEELYANIFKEQFAQTKSVNARGNWPKHADFFFAENYLNLGNVALEIIFEVRRFKSDNSLSMKTNLSHLKIAHPVDLSPILEDLQNVCNALNVETTQGEKKVEIVI